MHWTPSPASNQTHPKHFGGTVHAHHPPFLSYLFFYEPLGCAFFPNTPLTNTDTNNPTFLKPKVNIFGLHPTYLLTNKPTYLAEFTSSLGHSPGLFSRPLIHPFQFLRLSVIISMLLCSPSFVKLVSLYRSAP